MKLLIKLIGTGLGTGYSPVASGTVGSLVALAIWFVLPPMNAFAQLSLILITFAAGIPICTTLEKEYGHDPKQATWDEFVGQWTALFLLPKTLPILIASFLIFRALDIWKPFPARRSQKLPGGLGVMIDDLIVGIYTAGLLHLYLYII